MTKLFICLDPGGSQTKIIYQLPGWDKPRYLLMSPEVEEISDDNLQRYLARESKMSHPSPVRQAYLKINKQTFVVGHFAAKFDPEDRLQEIKYENAIYKAIAAVGVIAELWEIKPKRIALHLAILLPFNEYSDRQKMHDKLKEDLAQFSFRASTYSVKLEKFICRPEGGGLVAIHTMKKGKDWQQNKKLGVLMCGHRNLTGLNFEYGELSGESPLIGFAKFLDNVISRTSGLSRNRIAEAIFKGLESEKKEVYRSSEDGERTTFPNWSSLKAIEELANAKDSSLRRQEINDVSKAIKVATSEYWEIVSKWLAKIFPEDLDEVVISGGASRFLEPLLEEYFNCKHCTEHQYSSNYIRTGEYRKLNYQRPHFTPLIWGADFTEEIATILELSSKEESEKSLSYRLVDAYGLFELLIAKNRQRLQKKKQAKAVTEEAEVA